MKKIFSILAIAALMAGCSKEDSTTDVAPATFTLTGYTSNDTRTAFGTPDYVNNKIPFVWSEGDKIWSDSEQSNAAVINGDGSASFTFASEPESTIYYNMKGISATQANVPAEQSIANNLGQNGDFGYATVENGSFTLEHATAYLWFNTTTTIDNATLKTITINADGVNIAGKATWSGSSFGAVSEGKSEVTLTVNQPLSSTNGNVWAMVVLPADLSDKSVKVVYKLNVGGNTKYYTQTLSGKGLPAGTTQKISANISEAQLTDYRELRVLTFEDEDAKFSKYTFEDCQSTSYNIEKWTDLIPNLDYGDYMIYDPTYGGGNSGYNWWDSGNTYLAHEFPVTSRGKTYNASGHVISDSYTTDYTTYGYYNTELYVYADGAHSGNNCCVHHGYKDSGRDLTLPCIEFKDKVARVIDHMWIANTAYTYNQLISGFGYGSSYSGPADDSWFKIVAYGYSNASDTEPTKTAEFYLLKTGKQFVTDWTKWDLTGLGKVAKIEFNMFGSDDMIGSRGLAAPGYFAYDDVAVQWE